MEYDIHDIKFVNYVVVVVVEEERNGRIFGRIVIVLRVTLASSPKASQAACNNQSFHS